MTLPACSGITSDEERSPQAADRLAGPLRRSPPRGTVQRCRTVSPHRLPLRPRSAVSQALVDIVLCLSLEALSPLLKRFPTGSCPVILPQLFQHAYHFLHSLAFVIEVLVGEAKCFSLAAHKNERHPDLCQRKAIGLCSIVAESQATQPREKKLDNALLAWDSVGALSRGAGVVWQYPNTNLDRRRR